MALGGARPGAGRKSMKVDHILVMRATQPERFAQLEEAGELTAIQVMEDNMRFFHFRAAEVLAAIMAMPLGACPPLRVFVIACAQRSYCPRTRVEINAKQLPLFTHLASKMIEPPTL